MGKILFYLGLMWYWAGALIFNGVLPANEDDQSPRISRLVEESTKKRAIDESNLLTENPLMASDLPEALKYISQHTDFTYDVTVIVSYGLAAREGTAGSASLRWEVEELGVG
jgi:hypothetical protein